MNEVRDRGIDLAGEADFQLGALHVRPSSREVVLDGQTDMLEPRVMQVLTLLARRRGEVVSREQLIESCWEGRTVSEDAVNRSITKVRRWATPATFTLETIPRVGYRLVAAERPTESPPVNVPAPSGAAKPRYTRRKKILLGIAAVFMLCCAYGIWMGIDLWRDMNRPYFAVLPFDAAGSDAAASNLAETLATDINHWLTSQGFKVVSPTISAQYRGARKPDASEELGPRYIIEGSVRSNGDQLSVAVRIDSTVSPVTIWSREFEAKASDSQALSKKIGTVLAGLFDSSLQIGMRLPPDVAAGMLRINGLRTHGQDMDAYLAAKQLLGKAPTHYTAQIWMAVSTSEALDLLPSTERAAAINQARELVDVADAVVWGSLPVVRYLLMPTADWKEREQILREGLGESQSDGAGTRYLLAGFLGSSGHVREAVEFAQQSVGISSLSIRNTLGYASALDVAGERELADGVLNKASQLWPELESIERLRFSSALARGDLASASSLLQDSVMGPLIDPPAEHKPFATLIRALTKRDATDIAEVERQCANPLQLARDRAALCLQGLIALGRIDAFFDAAPAYFPEMRGATSKERDARWLNSPRVARYSRVLFRNDAQAIRADPRFIPIVQRLGLLDYWRTSGQWPDFCKSEPKSVCSKMKAENAAR